jgi:hypothetical protein
MKRLWILAAAVASFAALTVTQASAAILITVDKSAQRMTVEMNGHELYNWPVSTGKAGHDTPSGSFRAFRMEADHYSKEWDDAPMPHSIFFTQQGHAIHGTLDAKRLGTPASHGCVRLSTDHARLLFGLVKQDGVLNTRVVLRGEIPSGAGVPMARRAPRAVDPARDPAVADGWGGNGDANWWDLEREHAAARAAQSRAEQARAQARMEAQADARYYGYQPGRSRAARERYYGEEIAPRRYEYPDAPGRFYDRPRGVFNSW